MRIGWLLRNLAVLCGASCLLFAMPQAGPPVSPGPNAPTASRQTGPQSATTPNAAAGNDKEPSQAPASTTGTAQATKDDAWHMLRSACSGSKTGQRATAVRVLGLIPNDLRAHRMAEKALTDERPEVRAAAAAALGEANWRVSIPKLREAFQDDDPSVVLAAAHSLDLMHDDSAYEVYYEILTGDRKTGKGLVASQTAFFKDPKRLAQLGFEEGIGFIPFAGIGWQAYKIVKKDDASPIRAAAAKVLVHDPDPATLQALVGAASDHNWLVRTAVLETLTKRGDVAALDTVALYLGDDNEVVRYTAAAAVVRLSAIRESAHGPAKPKGEKKPK